MNSIIQVNYISCLSHACDESLVERLLNNSWKLLGWSVPTCTNSRWSTRLDVFWLLLHHTGLFVCLFFSRHCHRCRHSRRIWCIHERFAIVDDIVCYRGGRVKFLYGEDQHSFRIWLRVPQRGPSTCRHSLHLRKRRIVCYDCTWNRRIAVWSFIHWINPENNNRYWWNFLPTFCYPSCLTL